MTDEEARADLQADLDQEEKAVQEDIAKKEADDDRKDEDALDRARGLYE